MSNNTREWIWNSYFGVNLLGAGASVFLYLLVPAGTVKSFGGSVNNESAASWCSIVAAGDALVSFLAAVALRYRTPESSSDHTRIRALALTGIGLYCALHGGAFIYSARHRPQNFSLGSGNYLMTHLMVAFGAAAMIDGCYVLNRLDSAPPHRRTN